MDIHKLDELYKLYRFQTLPINAKGIKVYSYTSKYFNNADLVIIDTNVDKTIVDGVILEVEGLGFAVTVRNYITLPEAEESLFDGFFDIANSNKLLRKSYIEYTSKVEQVIFGKYEYIQSEYHDLEKDLTRKDDIVRTIFENLNTSGPVLVLLEAAAGFGKTSTVYEVIKHFFEEPHLKKIPLFTELSRNRQASIFKYVLYDEINRRFLGSSLELTNKHIIEGRIPVIIDGFDELLKQKSFEKTAEKFEDAEPMLETIKELLQGEAKIILTTRRTAIFGDDDFFKWLEDNSQNFTIFRYNLSAPTISDWIPPSKEKSLNKAGLNLKSIANPVLLAYLRSLNDQQFEKCLEDIDIIIEDYMAKLMLRENERQELNMTIEEQKKILKVISSHFTNNDITAESKEVLEKKIIDIDKNLIINAIERFPGDKRPTLDQFLNKLLIHAFLDRKSDNDHQIGFVNDFILGSFVGSNLLEEQNGWIGTERFIDFILSAYIPRSSITRKKIYELLNKELLNYLKVEKQIFIDNYLYGSINRDLQNQFIINIEFRLKFINSKILTNCIFSDCEFYNIDLFNEIKMCSNIFFINCQFFDCEIIEQVFESRIATFTNCNFLPELSFAFVKPKTVAQISVDTDELVYKRKVLERFWQSGKDQFNPHKRLNTLRLGVSTQEIGLIDSAIDQLVKEGIILRLKGHHSLHLNIQHINKIKEILGR